MTSLRTHSPAFGLVLTLATALVGASCTRLGHSAEPAVAIPPPTFDEPVSAGSEHTAVFAGGCFWGVQGVFQHVKGVTRAVSGYAGGAADAAEYETVGTGRTGHAESVQVTYDPKQVTYGQLLQVYFSVAHDPTQLNRQGPDRGTQYRSTIFATDPAQKDIAERYIAQLEAAKVYARPIVTTIESGKRFYPAEAYHQDYMTLFPDQPYIAYNDLPKVEHLKALFPARYREKPVLVSH